MATSGTAVYNLNFVEAIEEAFERAGVESRTGYDMKSARRSVNLLFMEWANKGINLWTLEERSQAITAGTSAYTLGADVVDLIEHVVTTSTDANASRYALRRVSVATHAKRSNVDTTGRPSEIYVHRKINGPEINLWPVPETNSTMYYWVMRRVEDAGDYTNNADIPFRFLPAFIAGLAAAIAEKKQPDNANLLMRLQAKYDMAWQAAADEDREKADLHIKPRASSHRVV